MSYAMSDFPFSPPALTITLLSKTRGELLNPHSLLLLRGFDAPVWSFGSFESNSASDTRLRCQIILPSTSSRQLNVPSAPSAKTLLL